MRRLFPHALTMFARLAARDGERQQLTRASPPSFSDAGVGSDAIHPGFPRWRCVFLTAAVKYDIKINAVLTI
jgi:hypothetical protein